MSLANQSLQLQQLQQAGVSRNNNNQALNPFLNIPLKGRLATLVVLQGSAVGLFPNFCSEKVVLMFLFYIGTGLWYYVIQFFLRLDRLAGAPVAPYYIP